MNHLRELLESIESGVIEANAAFGRAELLECVREIRTEGCNAMCFFMGEEARMVGQSFDVRLFRLPFKTCWFEARCADGSLFGVFARAAENGVRLIGWEKVSRGDWRLAWSASMNPAAEEGAASIVCRPGDHASTLDSQGDIAFVAIFLSALNCSNVTRVQTAPNAKLQKARAKRGKLPLFSYWTLHLGCRSLGEPMGGTHAGPRLHLRRGHPRQYQPGRFTWVEAHMVGNKAIGMVHKDYDGSGLAGAA